MARPKKWRYLSPLIKAYFYRPRGIAPADLEIAELRGDELEAMRLCHVEDLMHEDAAKKMRISRRTLERVLNSGQRKVTDALLGGKGINISLPGYVSILSRKRR
jgi:predicted DNA-binding protein (UPF0251 family)